MSDAAIDRWLTAAEQQVNARKRAIALHGLGSLVRRTPVDKGRARGNWQVAIGEATGAPSERVDPSGDTVIGEGGAVIGAANLGDQITISNHLPYILELERGHSQQAPSGMAEVTIEEIRTHFGAK